MTNDQPTPAAIKTWPSPAHQVSGVAFLHLHISVGLCNVKGSSLRVVAAGSRYDGPTRGVNFKHGREADQGYSGPAHYHGSFEVVDRVLGSIYASRSSSLGYYQASQVPPRARFTAAYKWTMLRLGYCDRTAVRFTRCGQPAASVVGWIPQVPTAASQLLCGKPDQRGRYRWATLVPASHQWVRTSNCGREASSRRHPRGRLTAFLNPTLAYRPKPRSFPPAEPALLLARCFWCVFFIARDDERRGRHDTRPSQS
ncbi:hypothetical protein C8Q78DRAFT_51299 [Trametes maxima]|nr:hypothetical protein C8Q78DRAFT_51299 [Trametes maxima]